MHPVTVAAEGETDLTIARAVLRLADLHPGTVIACRGKGNLDKGLIGYNAAAKGAPWFVLRDLDNDAPCPGTLVARLAPKKSSSLCFRIAVRASEAWLMSDRERMARFLRISEALVPDSPDSLDDPKLELVNLARRSTKKAIVAAMVPRAGMARRIGPEYEARLIEFALDHWRPEIGRTKSQSLDRCIRALMRLASELERSAQ
ncbi:hypothetical protein WME91_01375 [Sorangium sp. So ce269]